MKKIFVFIAAAFFASSMYAAETVTYVFSNKDWHATPANWEVGKSGGGFDNYGVQVTEVSTGANATCPEFYYNISKVVITYNTNWSAGAGTFDVQVGTNSPSSQEWAYSTGVGETANYKSTFNYASPQSGKVKLTVNCTTNAVYVVSVAITYTYDPSAPLIYTDNLDFGLVTLEGEADSYVKEYDVDVYAANLTQDITVACPSGITADKSKLDKAGGSLHLTVTAPVGEFSKTVTLTSGSTTYNMGIIGKVKKFIALPGVAATTATGSNSAVATVDGVAAIRVGTTSNGRMTVTVPAGAATLHFYAAAASGTAENSIFTIKTSDNLILGGSAINQVVKVDAGITNVTGTSFVLDALTPTPYRIDVPLTNVTAETAITLQTNSAKCFVVWGATYENATPSALDNAASEQKTVKTIENGQLVIIRDGIRYNALGTRIQ